MDPVQICNDARTAAHQEGCDVLILDTAGRLHIDEELMLAIAQYGNGSYRHVDNMRDLLEWYGKLAGEFAVVIRGAE